MITPDNAKAIGVGMIVRRMRGEATGGLEQIGSILVPEKDEFDHDHFSIGVVTSVGAKCTEVKIGDKILWKTQNSLPLPCKLTEHPTYYKVDESASVVAAVLPE